MSSKGSCFTSSYDSLSNVLKNKVRISAAVDENGKPIREFNNKEWVALWDTGATKSVITPEVTRDLKLSVVSKCNMSTPHGVNEANCYFINLLLPNNIAFPNLLAIEGIPTGCDILIGMDIIGKGDFAVSNHENKTVFSFRLPSIITLDFVKNSYLLPYVKDKDIPGRNDPCSCGSDKKFKKCCGKNT